jgi:hypothetical protein
MAMEGELTENDKCPDCGGDQPTKVCQSAAGYFIGKECPRCGPDARLSGYFTTREAAEAELGLWLEHNTRPSARDTDFHEGQIRVIRPLEDLLREWFPHLSEDELKHMADETRNSGET